MVDQKPCLVCANVDQIIADPRLLKATRFAIAFDHCCVPDVACGWTGKMGWPSVVARDSQLFHCLRLTIEQSFIRYPEPVQPSASSAAAASTQPAYCQPRTAAP